MAGDMMPGLEDPAAEDREPALALVRAIRRIYGCPLEAFHIHNIHEFAARLAAEGVRATEDEL
jgi:hypothetical protein